MEEPGAGLSRPVRPKLVLTGFMGAGKSTAAGELGGGDTDALFEERHGPIAEFFAHHGEPAFRAAEEEVVLEALAADGPEVLALGGGAVESPRVRAALAGHLVVWLDVPLELARTRVTGSARPLAADPEAFAARHAARAALYEEVAHAIVPPSFPPSELPTVVARLSFAPPGTRLLIAEVEGRPAYPVWVGEGLLSGGFDPGAPGRRFVVSDGAVDRLYGDALEPAARRITVMPGEQSKTVAHAEVVWTELVRAGATRGDHVVALGGGVVGDLAGFCAATYQRGVPCVQVPTTLVAQVDSAYGGKTGVDLPEAKNYVGAYHQPHAVVVDTATLGSLPEAERAAGFAEVVKTALIAGGDLWARVRTGAVDDPKTVLQCARAKLGVVAADERDGGRRQVLNLGHTVGHAIETATGYATYRHGEAVALGLLAALRLSGADELRSEVARLLAAQGLPAVMHADVDAVVAGIERDKKRVGEGPVPFVLVDAPGEVRHGEPVAPDALRAAVAELAS